MHLSDFTPPPTPAAGAALALATRYCSPAVLAHSIRSWVWAEAFARTEGRDDVDHELLYVAAVLHDIGLAPQYDNVASSYEEAGGHVAVALVTGAGWSGERAQRVLDVIIRHNWPAVDPDRDVEGYLLEIATGLDISGARPEALPARFVGEVVAAYPRTSLGAEFTAAVADQARRKPDTAARRLVDGGLARKLAQHPHESVC